MTRNTYIFWALLTALAPMIWGSTYIVTSELLHPNSPLTASTLRALPAGLILVLAHCALPVAHWWGRLILLSFLNIGFFFYCLFFAATHLPGGMAALVMAIGPLFVMGLSYFLLGSQLMFKHIVASFLALLSMALLLFNNQVTLNINGILVGLLGTISMALGIVLSKRWGRPTGMTLLNFTGWQLLLGGLMLLPVAYWVEGVPDSFNVNNIFGYAYLSVVGAMVAYAIWFNGISKLPAITLSFLGFLSSVTAVFLGYVFLDQTLTLGQWIGTVGIFITIILSSPQIIQSTHTNRKIL